MYGLGFNYTPIDIAVHDTAVNGLIISLAVPTLTMLQSFCALE